MGAPVRFKPGLGAYVVPGSTDPSHGFVGALGVRWEAGTGLYYMRNRWYDAGLGRFLGRDLLGGLNCYSYALQQPTTLIDRTGMAPDKPDSHRPWPSPIPVPAPTQPRPPSGLPAPPIPSDKPQSWSWGWVVVQGRFLMWYHGLPFKSDYGPDTGEVYNLRDDKGVRIARCRYAKEAASARKKGVPYYGVPQYGYDFGLPGLLGAGLNPTAQFVGGYYVQVKSIGNGNVEFVVYNYTSATSFFYGKAPSWSWGFMRTQKQTYHWIEPEPTRTDCSCQ